MTSSLPCWWVLFAVLFVGCGGKTDRADEDVGAAGTGATGGGSGVAGAGGVPAVGGRATGGSDEPASGGGATGGTATEPGTGGVGVIDCSTIGCAAPPLCATGCTEPCGCCLCPDGEAVDIDGVKHACVGGCWAPVDATCTYEGQTYELGAEFPAADDCNTCTCLEDGTVTCTGLVCPACNPNLELNRRQYVTTDLAQCALIDYLCVENTTPFTNGCGCGCEQGPNCPEWIDCMPGEADAWCADLDAFALACPFSGVTS